MLVEVHLPKHAETFPMALPCLLVYEMVYAINAAGPMQSIMSLGTPSGRREFWERGYLEEWGRSHPCLASTPHALWRDIVPAWFHVDGADFSEILNFWCGRGAQQSQMRCNIASGIISSSIACSLLFSV